MAAKPHRYESIRETMRDRISALSVGDVLPPERQLAEEFGVARMTLRRAVDELVREGYLIRRQGSGTYVAEPKIAQKLTVTSFSDDMRRRGLTPSSRTLSAEDHPAGPRLARRLEISPDAVVLTVVRLRLADDRPMAIETLHVPRAVVPDLDGDELTGRSFYELLTGRFGITIARGTQTIEPTVTNEEESEALEVPLHSPAFLFERTTRTPHDEVIEFVRSVYRGDRYKLLAELEAPAGPPRGTDATTAHDPVATAGS